MDNIKYLRSEESEGSLRNNIETAKEAGIFLLTLVVKVSDALPPLKAVSSGLHFVIEHIEVSFNGKISTLRCVSNILFRKLKMS